MSTVTSANFDQPPEKWWRSRTARRFRRHRLAMFGVVAIAILTLACVLGPYVLPYDQLFIDPCAPASRRL